MPSENVPFKEEEAKTALMPSTSPVVTKIIRPSVPHLPFRSPYNRSLLDSHPQRSIWEIPDSEIVFSSNFCSGNMTRASRGIIKNSFDIWVAGDAAPHLPDQYHRTWFYFSVTGVPQGEMLTFNFKNLSNQVSSHEFHNQDCNCFTQS